MQVKRVDFMKVHLFRDYSRRDPSVNVNIGPSVAEMDTRRDPNDVAKRDIANSRALRRNQETDNPCYKVSERLSQVA